MDGEDSGGRPPGVPDRRARWTRRALHRFIPAGLHDPVGLARRLIRSRQPDAIFALRAAALGLLLTPLDLLLAPFEHRRYRRAAPPQKPILLVCGPARSGTTVTAQLLIHGLPVSYFSNLTSVFPRAPLTAESLFGRRSPPAAAAFRSFYGRTSGWSGPNDALYLWDRWFGSERTQAPRALAPQARQAMAAFFGACEQQTGLPALGKNNALNASAHFVAEALPTAVFICLQRSRVPLAASLLKAQLEIHGSPGVAYGLEPPGGSSGSEAVEGVCRQILYHERLARQQLERLGPGRFLLVRFEDVQADPRAFVERIGRDVLGERVDVSTIDPLSLAGPGKQPAHDAALAARILETFDRVSGA